MNIVPMSPYLEEMINDPSHPSIGSLTYSDPSRPKLDLTRDEMMEAVVEIGDRSWKNFNKQAIVDRELADAWVPGKCSEPLTEIVFPLVNDHPEWVLITVCDGVEILSCSRCGHTPSVLDEDENEVFNPDPCDVVLVRNVMKL